MTLLDFDLAVHRGHVARRDATVLLGSSPCRCVPRFPGISRGCVWHHFCFISELEMRRLHVAALGVMLFVAGCTSNESSPAPDAGNDAPSADSAPDSHSCALSCKQTIDECCTQGGCIKTWPTDPHAFCGKGVGQLSISTCTSVYGVHFNGTDMSTDLVYDKASGQLIEILGYNANTETETCYAGPPEIDPPCAGDPTCTILDSHVDCSDSGSGGYGGYSGAGGGEPIDASFD